MYISQLNPFKFYTTGLVHILLVSNDHLLKGACTKVVVWFSFVETGGSGLGPKFSKDPHQHQFEPPTL